VGIREEPASVERDEQGQLGEATRRWITGAVGAGSRITGAVGAGSRITRLRPINEGLWHVNHALVVVDREGRRHRLILRRWARPGWEVEDPDFTVQRKVTVLGLLAGVPVPTPVVVAADPEGALCGAPALLLERLPGRSLQRPAAPRRYLRQLAEALPPIHLRDSRVRETVPAYRTYQDLRGLRAPGWLGEPALWDRAFAVAAGPPPDASPCLTPRDYHPGNTLWWRGSLTGVVDWTQASWGAPGIDVGWMRWNLAWDHGLQAADEFLRLWRSASGGEHHPYWDVLTAVDLVAAMHAERSLQGPGYQRLVEHVAAALSHL
jgi:aminoglycoside phosphotransferase (APT) family kinase protein